MCRMSQTSFEPKWADEINDVLRQSLPLSSTPPLLSKNAVPIVFTKDNPTSVAMLRKCDHSPSESMSSGSCRQISTVGICLETIGC